MKTNYLFFNKSRISANNSSCVGPAGAGSSAGASFFNLLIPLIITNKANATTIKEIAAAKKLPYLIAVPGITNAAKFSASIAFKAGFKMAGVMISSTKEVTILPKAPPITTPVSYTHLTLPTKA